LHVRHLAHAVGAHLSNASYGVALALSFVLPLAALAICFGIALYYGLPRRGAAH